VDTSVNLSIAVSKRPWILLTNHRGLLARDGNDSIKTNITIMQFTRSPQFENGPKVRQVSRKVWKFYQCAPISISGGSYDYLKENVEVKNDIRFIYNWYEVSNHNIS